MPEREKYEDGWTDTEKVNGGQEQEAIVNTSPKERGMFNVGVSYKQIKEVADVGEKVVANPDDAATDTLEKIKVGDTTYNIVSELPSTTSASAGQVLTLDENKVPEWASVPSELPSTSAASEGQVLSLDSSKNPVWASVSGGGDSIPVITLANGNSTTFAQLHDVFNDWSSDITETKLFVIKATTTSVLGKYNALCEISNGYNNIYQFALYNQAIGNGYVGCISGTVNGTNTLQQVISGSIATLKQSITVPSLSATPGNTYTLKYSFSDGAYWSQD